MPPSDPRFDKIATSLGQLTTCLAQQLAVNQENDRRLLAFEKRVTDLEALLKDSITKISTLPSLPSPSNGQDSPQPEQTLKTMETTSANPEPKPKTNWATIASKSPPPLTDRKRQALRRAFNPPAADTLQSGSYTFSKILEIETSIIPNFNPLDPAHIADPKYRDLPEEDRTRLALALQQDRCIRTLHFIRPNLVTGLAKYFIVEPAYTITSTAKDNSCGGSCTTFINQGWLSEPVAQDILNQRVPRPTKRPPLPYSSVAQALQTLNPSASLSNATLTPGPINTHPQASPLPPTPDHNHEPELMQDIDINTDVTSSSFQSTAFSPNSPSSPRRKMRKASRSTKSRS
ncbi:hypothetical protein HMPREF1544_07573 [Mucor circinelloides 1006PhL]|uniref:Uncharacterized protein n=1 Tax=Mucor circinelloides f. circinelloides (strain 1006PhL) TaxID=1220926 RepID=S2J6A0_MUCC1|nr:hypothetical protein HMPREF1544_07573 [Mucor circinelloides 1006PhL]